MRFVAYREATETLKRIVFVYSKDVRKLISAEAVRRLNKQSSDAKWYYCATPKPRIQLWTYKR